MLRRAVLLFALLGLAGAGFSARPAPSAPAKPVQKPRLVVVIVVDQLRWEYLTRYQDHFLPTRQGNGRPGGFRWLMAGADFRDANFGHYPLVTAVGHATVSTGAYPAEHGIIGNEWFDPEKGQPVYCVQDTRYPPIGVAMPDPRDGRSPYNLKGSTLADELRLSTANRAKVASLSLKDRAAIILGGHRPDLAAWFDARVPGWTTSPYYRPNGKLYAPLAALNAAGAHGQYYGQPWELLLPEDRYAPIVTGGQPTNRGRFPHVLTSKTGKMDKEYYDAFAASPFSNEYLFRSAQEVVTHLELGQDDVPDFLGLNLAANDIAGHAFGPHSREVEDLTLRTDRQLAAFFDFLRRRVPGGLDNVTVALTADHGVAPLLARSREAGLLDPTDAETPAAALGAAIDGALDHEFGAETWLAGASGFNLYLSDAAIRNRRVDAAAVEQLAVQAARGVPGVRAAFGRGALMDGILPPTDLAARMARSYYPPAGGDVVVVTEQFWLPKGTLGTTHGTPYKYDTHVPLLLRGRGIRPGRYYQPVDPANLAPTLAALLEIEAPSGTRARVLHEAMQ